jgi:hypothetical protein
LGRPEGDLGIDRIAVRDHGGDEFAGQGGRIRVPFLLGQMAFEHRVRRALSEVGLEDRCECQPATGPPAADAVSPRRHRRGP